MYVHCLIAGAYCQFKRQFLCKKEKKGDLQFNEVRTFNDYLYYANSSTKIMIRFWAFLTYSIRTVACYDEIK